MVTLFYFLTYQRISCLHWGAMDSYVTLHYLGQC